VRARWRRGGGSGGGDGAGDEPAGDKQKDRRPCLQVAVGARCSAASRAAAGGEPPAPAAPRPPPTRRGVLARLALRAGAMCAGLVGLFACAHHAPRSRHSFSDIQRLVVGRSEVEVEAMLGAPDVRQRRLATDEVWIWWDYTYLAGAQYAPELRQQVVNLVVAFECPAGAMGGAAPHSTWRVAGPFAVNFTRSADDLAAGGGGGESGPDDGGDSR
jgi:hypothetical protein